MSIKRITLPVLKNIEGTNITNDNDTIKSILPKLKEEYEEFIEAVENNHDIAHQLEEYFDLGQILIRLGKTFIRDGIDLEKASKVHYNKLKTRNWVFDNHVDIYFSIRESKHKLPKNN